MPTGEGGVSTGEGGVPTGERRGANWRRGVVPTGERRGVNWGEEQQYRLASDSTNISMEVNSTI
jgi:hypothetical protein